MKLQEIKLIIIRMTESFDKEGNVFLKCKGFHRYKNKKGFGYNQFTSIRLYPCNEQQYNETKNRFMNQTTTKPTLSIMAYDSDLKTYLVNGVLVALLDVNKYDFEKNKLFNKKLLLNKGE